MTFLVYFRGRNHFTRPKVNEAIREARCFIKDDTEARFAFLWTSEVRFMRVSEGVEAIIRLFYYSREKIETFNKATWALVNDYQLVAIKDMIVIQPKYIDTTN